MFFWTQESLHIPPQISKPHQGDNELFGPWDIILPPDNNNGASGVEITIHYDHPAIVVSQPPSLPPDIVRKISAATIAVEELNPTTGSNINYFNYEQTPIGLRLISIYKHDGKIVNTFPI